MTYPDLPVMEIMPDLTYGFSQDNEMPGTRSQGSFQALLFFQTGI